MLLRKAKLSGCHVSRSVAIFSWGLAESCNCKEAGNDVEIADCNSVLGGNLLTCQLNEGKT